MRRPPTPALRGTFAVCIALAPLFAATAAWPATTVVPDDAPTIQVAINSRPDTVLVRPGNYSEDIVIDGLGPALLKHPDSAPGDSVRIKRLRIETCCHKHKERGLTVAGIHIRGLVTLQTLDTSVPWVEFISCRIDSGVQQLFEDTHAVYRQSFVGCLIRGNVFLRGGVDNVFQHNEIHGGILNITTDKSMVVTDNVIIGPSGGNFNGVDSGVGNVQTAIIERNTIRGFRHGIWALAEYVHVNDNIISDCQGDGIVIGAGTSAEASRNRITNAENGIRASSAVVLAAENIVLGSRQVGIDLSSSDSITVVGNVVGRSHGDGIVARMTTECCTVAKHRFDGNTSFGNQGSGFVIEREGKEPVGGVVQRNIAYRNGGWGLDFRSWEATIPACNDWFENAKGAVQGQAVTVGPTDLALDPMFCNVDADSVWLSSASPLLEAAGCGLIGALGQGCLTTTGTLLSRITVTSGGEGVTVRWEFADDRNVVRTWLERSVRGSEWSEVAASPRKDGTGYLCVDPYAIPGRLYRYRVAWVDVFGATLRSGSVEAQGIAPELALALVHPNPSVGPVRFAFTLSRDGVVDLGVYDLHGRRIAQLAHGTMEAGAHSLEWQSERTRSGIYFVRLQAESAELTRTFIVTR